MARIPFPPIETREIHCTNAQDFIQKLRLTSDLWEGYNYGDIGFRGQGNAVWTLVPSAFRLRTRLGYFRNATTEATGLTVGDIARQCTGELMAVSQFLALSDSIGLPVPGDNQSIRNRENYVRKYDRRIERSWPPVEVLETLAIAQHHGVPTRLIDFSYHPLIAAFFAASSESTADQIAVWALNVKYIRKDSAFQSDSFGIKLAVGASSRIRIVTVPRAANSYLHAQHGFFLIDTKMNMRPQVQPINIVLQTEVDNWHNLGGNSWEQSFGKVPPVTKLVVPANEKAEILRLLYKEGMTHAHIYPSYDNVVKTLQAVAQADTVIDKVIVKKIE